jgi:hypothetical protein
VDEAEVYDENDGDIDFYYRAQPGGTTPIGYGRIKDKLSFIGGGVRLDWQNIWAGGILNAFPQPGDFSTGAAQIEAEISVTLDRRAGVFYRSTTGNGTFSGGNPSHHQLILGPGTYVARDHIEVSAQSQGEQSGSQHTNASVEIGTRELRRRLVLATHGWKPAINSPFSWVARLNPFRNDPPSERSVIPFSNIVVNIRDRAMWAYWFNNPNRPLDRQATAVRTWTPSSGASQPAPVAWEQWDFAVVDWEADATSISPWPAAQRAREIGTQIGLDLVNAPERYDQILLIGHSAGSWLIEAIADIFHQYSPDTYISMSFLDAYVPGIRHHDSSYGITKLGKHADFADHYVDTGFLPYTDAILPLAFNIDVTHDKLVGQRGHGWPVDWYLQESEKNLTDYKLGWWDSWIMKPGYSWRDDPSAVHSIYVNEWKRDLEFVQGKGVLLSNGAPIINLPDLPAPGGPTQNFTPRNQHSSDANNVVIDLVAEGERITMTVENPAPAARETPSEALEQAEFPSVWYEFTLSASCFDEPIYITFDYEFLRGSDGMLAVFVNNELRFQAVEEWTTGRGNPGWLSLGDSPAESYVLRFELFSGENAASELQLTRLMTSIDLTSPYAQWSQFHGLTSVNNHLGYDPDGDGRLNIMEFAFDDDPLSGANSGKISTAFENVEGQLYFTITVPVRNGASFSGSTSLSATVDGIVYTIEGTEDLNAYDAAISEVVPSNRSGLPLLSSCWSYRTFRYPTPVGITPWAFFRTGVAAAP